MKATGVVRRLDTLGRVVLPIELRRQFNINTNDALEVSVNGEAIILTKYAPKCIFCKSADNVIKKMGQHICKACIDDIIL